MQKLTLTAGSLLACLLWSTTPGQAMDKDGITIENVDIPSTVNTISVKRMVTFKPEHGTPIAKALPNENKEEFFALPTGTYKVGVRVFGEGINMMSVICDTNVTVPGATKVSVSQKNIDGKKGKLICDVQ